MQLRKLRHFSRRKSKFNSTEVALLQPKVWEHLPAGSSDNC
jgi:hypothetical protein